jgi:hypothetical protein
VSFEYRLTYFLERDIWYIVIWKLFIRCNWIILQNILPFNMFKLTENVCAFIWNKTCTDLFISDPSWMVKETVLILAIVGCFTNALRRYSENSTSRIHHLLRILNFLCRKLRLVMRYLDFFLLFDKLLFRINKLFISEIIEMALRFWKKAHCIF